MATLDSSLLTVPSVSTETDAENQARVAALYLRIWAQAKESGYVFDDGFDSSTAFTTLWTNQDTLIIKQSNYLEALYPTLNTTEKQQYCEQMVNENSALRLLTSHRENYKLRSMVLAQHDEAMKHLTAPQASTFEGIQEGIQDLKFNGYTLKIGPLEITLHGQAALADFTEG